MILDLIPRAPPSFEKNSSTVQNDLGNRMLCFNLFSEELVGTTVASLHPLCLKPPLRNLGIIRAEHLNYNHVFLLTPVMPAMSLMLGFYKIISILTAFCAWQHWSV